MHAQRDQCVCLCVSQSVITHNFQWLQFCLEVVFPLRTMKYPVNSISMLTKSFQCLAKVCILMSILKSNYWVLLYNDVFSKESTA